MNNHVYTYLGSCPKRTDEENEAMCKLWEKSWGRHGWNPIVLTVDVAREMPWFEKYRETVSRFPSRNDPTYELICFERWAAMAAVGGGLMSDYDVMNYGIRPGQHFSLDERHRIKCMQGHVPSLVNGTAKAYDRMCQIFAEHDPSKSTHVSDMHIISTLKPDVEYIPLGLVTEFNQLGWQTAKLVHYSSHSLKTFKPKSQWIPILEKNRKLSGALC